VVPYVDSEELIKNRYAAKLVAQLGSVKIGIATSVKKQFWNDAEIYPRSRCANLILSPEQRSLLALFALPCHTSSLEFLPPEP
jgi:hypothetical protein